METERIMEDAEMAACFLRALTDKGVPVMAAVQLTASYLVSHRMSEAAKEEPKEPWRNPD